MVASSIRPGNPRAVAIVPARLGSTRLPRKMLLRETGRYLFEHTVENARASGVFERVILATDSAEIEQAARSVDIEVVLTSPDHISGTDRVNEAFGQLRSDGEAWEVIVNVQGDEPELPAASLRDLTRAFDDERVELATLYNVLEDAELARDPAVVKVVIDGDGDALYFSRAAIPAHRDAPSAPLPYLRHVGVYAFRPAALSAFCALAPGRLERAESLEQLRWLEAGRRIRCIPAAAHPPGIDTLDQYAAFRARLEAKPTRLKRGSS